jgi:hexosaminidase
MDKIPLIPYPNSVSPSVEILNIKKIKSIQFDESNSTLFEMGLDLQSFWLKHTQHEVGLKNKSENNSNVISLEVKDFSNQNEEYYQLEIGENQITIIGQSSAGVYRGVKTLEQIVSLSHLSSIQTIEALPTGTIEDAPVYGYRGAMLDVSRHFFSVEDVKRYIDLLSIYKINFLHLHLSDDQGWRIEIKAWPKLTSIGGKTEVGGSKGGFYSQLDYKEIVAYAQRRFITIVPEIDMPGHTNAALASYAELNCDDKIKELYTGMEVGFSTLCVNKKVTYEFVSDVVSEISAMTPGAYFHIGGDESHVTPKKDYIKFMNRVFDIVKQNNKIPMGWDEVVLADIPEVTVAQYWAKAENAIMAMNKKANVLMSPASYAYLDMKYDSITKLGLKWAGYITIQKGYEWDPVGLVPELDPTKIIGIEAPIWSETLEDFDDIVQMAFPRILGYSEIGWTKSEIRDWKKYSLRLSYHGEILDSLDIKFYPSSEINWK